MKKIILIAIALTQLIGCIPEGTTYEHTHKYEQYDVVYLKPDSTKGIVDNKAMYYDHTPDNYYRIRYMTTEGYDYILLNEIELY